MPGDNNQTFQYADKTGALKQFQAQSPEHALSTMPADADPTSGVQVVSPSLITTSGPARMNFNKNSMALNNVLNQLGATSDTNTNTAGATDDTSNDPILKGLNDLKASQDVATKQLIASTQASYQNQIGTLNKSYEDYKGGLQLLGIQHNEAQFTPDLLAGHIQQALNDHLNKVNKLTAEENKAIITAKQAQDNNEFKTLDAMMKRLKDIKTQKTQAVKDMYDTISSQQKVSADLAHNIYDSMQTLDPDSQEQFIQAVANKFGLSLSGLTTALADEKQKRDAADLKTQNTESIIKKREAPKPVKAVTVKNSKKGGTGKTGSPSKSEIAQVEANLSATRGEDEYVDPYVYKDEFDKFSGTTKQFITAFPPKNYVNPKATNLPDYLMPAKTKSSGRTS